MNETCDKENTEIGGITWHSSDEDSGPDVGISVYLGENDRLWAIAKFADGEQARDFIEQIAIWTREASCPTMAKTLGSMKVPQDEDRTGLGWDLRVEGS